MSDATARFALPFITPGQAQKELFHNEALTRIDALLQPAVEAVAVNSPPPAPVPGQCWIIGAAPTGAWAGQPNMLASWTEGGWRFVAGRTGMILWSNADRLFVWFDGTLWRTGDVVAQRVIVAGQQVVSVQQSPIANPAGGTVSDTQSRAAIAAILTALRNHGLVAV
jgi:hypothetical protein